ncbi:hypothetical protein [Roseateles sp.]|jgi:transcriptional regulator with XRE-family HTH domain|uniref:hypothetical protein n=1 Tax=Roseateles sp. TaxID=1971397 RepID=UPI003BA7AB09
MENEIPSTDQLRQRLLKLSWAQVREICKRTGVPVTTVWKVRSGETVNPGIETVRAIWPDLPALEKEAA